MMYGIQLFYLFPLRINLFDSTIQTSLNDIIIQHHMESECSNLK